MNGFGEFNLAQLVTALCTAGTFGAVLTFVIRWRGQTLGAEKNIRDHYAEEVERLRTALGNIEEHYRRMLDDSDRRHAECQRDRDDLRKEVTRLQEEVRGLRDQIREYSADKLLRLESMPRPSERAPHATAAAHRLKKHGH